MKKVLAATLVLCLLLSVFSFAFAASVKLAVKGGSICLRTGPDTSYSVKAYLKDGQRITVLSTGSAWSKVRTSNGKEGYIKNLYISGIGSKYADGTKYYAQSYKAYIKTSSSNGKATLRAGAGSSTSSLGTLPNGTQVKVLGENGSWKLISTLSGTQAFVSSNLLTSSKTASATAKVIATGLYMRSGPSSSYEAITLLRNGAKVTILSTSNKSWWLVQSGKYTGYMYSKYLEKQ